MWIYALRLFDNFIVNFSEMLFIEYFQPHVFENKSDCVVVEGCSPLGSRFV